MVVKIKEKTYFGWNCFFLESDNISVGIAPQIGGRIISFNFDGRELFFVQKEHAAEIFDFSATVDLIAEKLKLGHRLWGGDKTWVAPQSAWLEGIPPLELDAGVYEAELGDNFVFMRSPLCRETSLRIERKISLNENGVVQLEESFLNENEKPIRRGIWNVTQCLRPFDVYLPLNKSELRAYPDEGASVELFEEVVEEIGGWTLVRCNKPFHFKYGGVAQKGVVIALRDDDKGNLVFAKCFEADPTADYAHGSSVEVYNSPKYNYLEMEIHAPLVELAPGERQTHRQEWWVNYFGADITVQEIFEARRI